MRKPFFCESSRPMHFSTQFSLVFKQMIFCLNGKVSVAVEDVPEIDNIITPETFVVSNMPDNKCHIHMWNSGNRPHGDLIWIITLYAKM